MNAVIIHTNELKLLHFIIKNSNCFINAIKNGRESTNGIIPISL